MKLRPVITVSLLMFATCCVLIFVVGFWVSPGTQKVQTPTTDTPIGCGSAGIACTRAEVAAHNSPDNCWVIYEEGYYIVTGYIASHPGGNKVFTANTCGRDITAYLSGSQSSESNQHSHSTDALATLKTYYVGPIQ